jgi:CheY-like chemotaxis protein
VTMALTLLIVEDEPLVLMDIVDVMTARGFHVLEASNADEAIIQLIAHPEIQVLFTDVDMPGSGRPQVGGCCPTQVAADQDHRHFRSSSRRTGGFT